MRFPELVEVGIEADFESETSDFRESGAGGGLYVFHTVHGSVRGGGEFPRDRITLTRGTAVYSDGSEEELDLGTIVLTNDTGRETLAEQESVTAGSDAQTLVFLSNRKIPPERLSGYRIWRYLNERGVFG